MTVDVSPGYRADFAEAAAWLEAERRGLARELIDEIQSKVESIRQFPDSFPRVPSAGSPRVFRQALLQRFKFSLIFEAKAGTVTIHALAHFKRRQNYWRKRI